MTAITIPAAAVRVGDLWVWTVPGDRVTVGPAPTVNHGHAYTDVVAPQEWAQYDKPCETPTCQQPSERGDGTLCGSDYGVTLVDVVRYEDDGESTFFHLPICLGHRLALGEHVIAYEPPPDCRDGRQVVELRTECPHCGGFGATSSGYPDYDALDCERCDADPSVEKVGTVLLARATIQVVPVTTNQAADECPGVPHLLVDDGEVYACGLTVNNGAGPIPLDPLPVPHRDFGVVARVVS